MAAMMKGEGADMSTEVFAGTDADWMSVAREAALSSTDRSRQTGAAIVSSSGERVAVSCNSFPVGIADQEERHVRPAKYLWTEHAERNAIYAAARQGKSTAGCTMYLPWFPCADCARGIVQSGISVLACVELDWDDPKFAADFAVAAEMLEEAGVAVRFLEGVAPVAVPSPR